MIELHVWGVDNKISITSPECIAAAWLLCIHLVPQQVPFLIVTSNNTNLTRTGRLPLLVENDKETQSLEGYADIAEYISSAYPTDSTKFVPDQRLLARDQLANMAFTAWMHKTINYLNQYNLYVNTKNYENYTRKVFLKYLPFPMQYNQPLKFYHQACEQVGLIGLGTNSAGFFGLGGHRSTGEEPAETEMTSGGDDPDNEKEEVAISALHERMLVTKSKNKAALKESRNSFKCLTLWHSYVKHIHALFGELNEGSPVDFANLFRPKKVSSSELLLYAYFAALTDLRLPDRCVAEYTQREFPAFWKFATVICEALNGAVSPDHFREGRGRERPTLLNEVLLLAGVLTV